MALASHLVGNFLTVRTTVGRRGVTPAPMRPLSGTRVALVTMDFARPGSGRRLSGGRANYVGMHVGGGSAGSTCNVGMLLARVNTESSGLCCSRIMGISGVSSCARASMGVPVGTSSGVRGGGRSFGIRLVCGGCMGAADLSVGSKNAGGRGKHGIVRVGGVTKRACLVTYGIGNLPLGFVFSAKTSSIALSGGRTTFVLDGKCLSASSVVKRTSFRATSKGVTIKAVIGLGGVRVDNLILCGIGTSVVGGSGTPLLLKRDTLDRLKGVRVSCGGSALAVVE